MSNFQNGGSKGKDLEDNLFLLRALIDYMGKQLWLTFYDTEKYFDSLYHLTLSAEKCELLKINSKCNGET